MTTSTGVSESKPSSNTKNKKISQPLNINKQKKVNYVEGLGHNLFSVSQFCDAHLEVAFQKHTCYVRNLESVYLLSGSRDTNLYTLSFEDMTTSTPIYTKAQGWGFQLGEALPSAYGFVWAYAYPECKWEMVHLGISHETSVALTPQQNGIIERRSRTLVEAARTMLIFEQAILSLWAETVATTCYNQNRSLLRRHHDKTPYELLHDKKPDMSYLHVFGALCYPKHDVENLKKLQTKANIGIFIGYAPTKKAFQIY
nr:putative RNA-directed DNA polymerase [Tanacetum cinerariifolium]